MSNSEDDSNFQVETAARLSSVRDQLSKISGVTIVDAFEKGLLLEVSPNALKEISSSLNGWTVEEETTHGVPWTERMRFDK